MALVRDFDALVTLLAERSIVHQADAANATLLIATEHRDVRAMQAISWRAQQGVVQLVQGIAVDVPPGRVAAIEEAIVRLNHVLPMPGLDFNHARRLLAYRLVLPLVPLGGVEAATLEACFRLAVRVGAELVPSLARVVAGTLAPADVVADVNARVPEPTPDLERVTSLLRPFWLDQG